MTRTTATTAPTDMLDIIFLTRNKAYGAYYLRRNYDQFLGRSLFLGLGMIALAFAIPHFIRTYNQSHAITDNQPVVVIEMSAPPVKTAPEPPIIVPPTPNNTAPSSRPKVAFLPPVVLEDKNVAEKPNQADLKTLLESDAEVGTKSQEGNSSSAPTQITQPDISDVVDEMPKPKAKENEILTFVEKSSAFPGGEAELMKYLNKTIRYPEIALENGIQGKVVLSFVVETDGKIKDIQIIRKIGGGCEEEAIRAVRSMPYWIPAEQNGRLVRHRYTLPINFKRGD